VEPSDDVHAADWVVRRLADRSHRVSMLLPPGLAAYARLLHPIVTETAAGRRLTRWRDVAAPAGLLPLDRDLQFASIAAGARQHAGAPLHGELPSEDRQRLLRLLGAHTSTAQRCWFCVWDGYGPADAAHRPGRASTQVFTRASDRPSRPPDRQDVPQRPTVRGFLERRYLLYLGALTESLELSVPPGLWWPDDHAWCAASDADLDSTYVGGSAELVGELLADPQLEALPAEPSDLITLEDG
jgi:hypothetical protein